MLKINVSYYCCMYSSNTTADYVLPYLFIYLVHRFSYLLTCILVIRSWNIIMILILSDRVVWYLRDTRYREFRRNFCDMIIWYEIYNPPSFTKVSVVSKVMTLQQYCTYYLHSLYTSTWGGRDSFSFRYQIHWVIVRLVPKWHLSFLVLRTKVTHWPADGCDTAEALGKKT